MDSGEIATSTDENNQVTTYTYDTVNRLRFIDLPNGIQISTSYEDESAEPWVTRASTADSGVQANQFDSFNRIVLEQIRDGAIPVTTTETLYDSVGRVQKKSNPYASGETKQWVTYSYDGFGRVIEVTPPGTGGSYAYSFLGNAVTVTEPAQKQRRFHSDALGRLIQVDEPGWGDGAPATNSIGIVRSGPENSGSMTVTVNGFSKSASFPASTYRARELASALANAFNNDPASPVFASSNGHATTATLYLTAKVNGDAGNYPVSVASDCSCQDPYFTATSSAPNFSGGRNDTSEGEASLVTPMKTTYSYDVLDNLTQVQQALGWPVGGIQAPPQVRSYSYDGLGRLTSSNLPESNLTEYFYVPGSHLLNKVRDARGVEKIVSFDDLNRLSTISYEVGTTGVPDVPTISFTYGTNAAAFENGRLIKTSSTGSEEIITYNQLGQIASATTKIDNVPYAVTYNHDPLNGRLNSVQYPSGRVATQSFDSIGRLTAVSSAGTAHMSGLTYNAAGQITSFSYGNGIIASLGYNERLHLASIRYDDPNSSQDVLNLAYAYTGSPSGTDNNGQIRKITYYNEPGVEDPTKSQNFEYDAWRRLKKAYTSTIDALVEGTWRLEWSYDRFGNRRTQNLTGGSVEIGQPQLIISETTNRIVDTGFEHDAVGNMTKDGLYQYVYDAANRITQVKNLDGSVRATYVYGNTALRLKKIVGTTTTVSVYGNGGLLAEYENGALKAEYLFAGGNQFATLEADGQGGVAVTYQHRDHLSTRAETNSSGTVVRRVGHFPFGEKWYEVGGTGSSIFTTYNRDSESTLDYAIFRGYSSRLGRFMSTDALSGVKTHPQSLALYSYVSNDPINSADPFGLFCQSVTANNQYCFPVNVWEYNTTVPLNTPDSDLYYQTTPLPEAGWPQPIPVTPTGCVSIRVDGLDAGTTCDPTIPQPQAPPAQKEGQKKPIVKTEEQKKQQYDNCRKTAEAVLDDRLEQANSLLLIGSLAYETAAVLGYFAWEAGAEEAASAIGMGHRIETTLRSAATGIFAGTAAFNKGFMMKMDAFDEFDRNMSDCQVESGYFPQESSSTGGHVIK